MAGGEGREQRSPRTPTRSAEPWAALHALDPSWLDWISDALLHGQSRTEIVEGLTAAGTSAPEALLQRLEQSTLFRWGLSHLRERRQRELLERVQRALQSPLATLARVECPSRAFFYQHYYAQHQPVLIEGWGSDWAARRWTPRQLGLRFADEEVELTAGRSQHADYDQRAASLRETRSFGAFCEQIESTTRSNDVYLIARNRLLERPPFDQLWEEIDESRYLNPAKRRGCGALWLGPAGTLTPLHHDTCNILFVQLYGEKRFWLLPPAEAQLWAESESMYSAHDPREAEPRGISLTLQPGEALFIPVGWWHQVEAESASISLAMTHFYESNSFDWYRPGEIGRRTRALTEF